MGPTPQAGCEPNSNACKNAMQFHAVIDVFLKDCLASILAVPVDSILSKNDAAFTAIQDDVRIPHHVSCKA